MTTGSKTIDRAIANHPKVVANESWKDSDGYWLVLEPGYMCAFSDCHTIHEWNVKDVLDAIKNIQVCECQECSHAAQ